MTKKNKRSENRYAPLLIGLIAVVVISAISWMVYRIASDKEHAYDYPNHTIPYVDGESAVVQVESFYRQYIDQRSIKNIPDFHKKLIKAYGNEDLVFYSDYYQHGFDPITCSTTMPLRVTASLVSTGPYATVNAVAEYPDKSRATIVATVVLGNGMDINSIACPGEKGGLPPQ